MNIHIVLDDENRWLGHQPDRVSGSFLVDGRFVRESDVTGTFGSINRAEEAIGVLQELKGRFRWIRSQPGHVILAVDHLRSLPLFYAVQDNDVYISDLPDLILKSLSGPQIDWRLAAEYLIAGYVTGSDTLVREIRQAEPGTIVEIRDKKNGSGISIDTFRYVDYIHSYRGGSREQFTRDLDDMVVQTMERAVQYAGGRPVVLPLSGGYDSRLIALSLSRLNYSDVICYSYGREGSTEMKLSRRIAEELGFRWTNVIHTPEKWRDWFNRSERAAYYRAASRLSGIPNIQELVAVGEMKETGAIPAGSVIMGGHLGDALVGGRGQYDSYTYRDHPETKPETVLRHILHYHYHLWDWSGYQSQLESFFSERILQSLLPIDSYPDSPSACEAWNLQQRQSRFIIPVSRLYDFFGYDYWMPFCDQDYMRFWLSVPLQFRHDKNLYTQYIDRQSPFQIAARAPGKRILAMRERIRHTPLFRPAQFLYNSWMQRRKRKNEYRSHPMAWYGIMEEEAFEALYTGRENINSFQSLELLRTLLQNGYISPDEILQRSCKKLAGTGTDIHG